MSMDEMNLDEISKRNLVWFYREKLSDSDLIILSEVERKKLAKMGILTLGKGSGGGRGTGGSSYRLSDYGARLLKEEMKK